MSASNRRSRFDYHYSYSPSSNTYDSQNGSLFGDPVPHQGEYDSPPSSDGVRNPNFAKTISDWEVKMTDWSNLPRPTLSTSGNSLKRSHNNNRQPSVSSDFTNNTVSDTYSDLLNSEMLNGNNGYGSRYGNINSQNAFEILPQVKISNTNDTNENIVTPQLPPVPPSSYRVTPTKRQHKKSSFAIIAEITPNQSRATSPDPGGRISPFRGRGFKSRSNSPHNSHSTGSKTRSDSPHHGSKPQSPLHAVLPRSNSPFKSTPSSPLGHRSRVGSPQGFRSRTNSPHNYVIPKYNASNEVHRVDFVKQNIAQFNAPSVKSKSFSNVENISSLNNNYHIKTDRQYKTLIKIHSNSGQILPKKSLEHQYENLQKIQNNIRAIESVNNAMYKKPPVPKPRSHTPEARVNLPSKIPRRKSIASPLNSITFGRDRSNSPPKRTIEDNSKKRIDILSPNNTTVINDGAKVSNAPLKPIIKQEANRRRTSSLSPNRGSTKTESNKILEKSPKITRRSTSLLRVPNLSPIQGTPTKIVSKNSSSSKLSESSKIPKIPKRPSTLKTPSSSRNPSRNTSRDPSPSTNKVPTSPTKIPKKVYKKSVKSTSIKPGKTASATKTRSAKDVTKEPKTINRNKETNNSIKSKESKNDRSNNNGNDSSLLNGDIKESATHDTTPAEIIDEDEVENEEDEDDYLDKPLSATTDIVSKKMEAVNKRTSSSDKLIPLTKANVVSMTTAAITSQPVEIATTVTSQLPNMTNNNRSDVSKANSEASTSGTSNEELKKSLDHKISDEKLDVRKLTETPVKKVGEVTNKVTDYVTNTLQRVEENVATVIESGTKATNENIVKLKNTADAVNIGISNTTANIKNDAVNIVGNSRNDTVNTVGNIKNDTANIVGNIKNDTVNTVGNIKNDTINTVGNIKNDTVNTVGNIKNDTVNTVGNIKNDTINTVDKIKHDSLNMADKIKNDALNTVGNITQTVDNKVAEPMKAVSGVVRDTDNNIKINKLNHNISENIRNLEKSQDSSNNKDFNHAVSKNDETKPATVKIVNEKPNNQPVDSMELVNVQSIKGLPEAELESGNMYQNRDVADGEEKKPRLCCIPCSKSKCCKKRSIDSVVTTASGEKKSCWKKLNCRKKNDAAQGSTSSIETIAAADNITSSQRTLQASEGSASRGRGRLCLERFICCRSVNKVDSSDSAARAGCCSCLKKGKPVQEVSGAWARPGRRESILSGEPKGCCEKLKLCFPLSCSACCKKKEVVENNRRTSIFSKKQSIAPTLPIEDTRPKLDVSLIEHASLTKGAIPVLPICLAWFCLILNVVVPGLGTIISGMFCVCLGIPRFGAYDSPHARFASFIVNLFVGVAQLFTVLFCLVGWGWAIWWGVIMIRSTRKYKRTKQEHHADEEVSPVVVNQNHTDVEQGR